MKNYYQKEIETASREEILRIQNEKIVKQVKYVYDNVPYYRAKPIPTAFSAQTSRNASASSPLPARPESA